MRRIGAAAVGNHQSGRVGFPVQNRIPSIHDGFYIALFVVGGHDDVQGIAFHSVCSLAKMCTFWQRPDSCEIDFSVVFETAYFCGIMNLIFSIGWVYQKVHFFVF